MNYYDLDASEKELAGADYLARVQRELIFAFLRKAKAQNLTKAKLARELGVEKSTISRLLSGKANLTSRTIGELCWALDVDPRFAALDFPDHRTNALQAAPPARVAAFGARAQTVHNAGEHLVVG